MRRTLIFACCFVLAGLAAQLASAAMINGQFVPDSLKDQVGAQYRLIFATSGTLRADSGDPLVYDAFLTDQVKNTMLGEIDYGWKAVVSTAASTRIAKDIVSDAAYVVDPSEYMGVYNTAGIRVAASGDDMLDNSLLQPVLFDQHGTSVYDGYAWTGSISDGTGASGSLVGDLSTFTMLGATGANDGTWLRLGSVRRPGLLGSPTPIPFVARIYGMSDVMTVPAVPEPATIIMWSLFTGVAGLVFWRKRRQS